LVGLSPARRQRCSSGRRVGKFGRYGRLLTRDRKPTGL